MGQGLVTLCWAFKLSFHSLNLHSCCFTICRHLQDVVAALLSSLVLGKKVGMKSDVVPGLLDICSMKSFRKAIMMNSGCLLQFHLSAHQCSKWSVSYYCNHRANAHFFILSKNWPPVSPLHLHYLVQVVWFAAGEANGQNLRQMLMH